MSSRYFATLVVVLSLFTWATTLRASDAGTSADGGPTRCSTSGDCSGGTPYCHPTLDKCVQCIADTNCTGVSPHCDLTRGVCSTCRTNADCFGPTPYCGRSLPYCVECITDANCGKQGVHCGANGVCGSCGDGVCSVLERSGIFGQCKDCLLDCGKNDLQSKTGDMVASGTLSKSDGPYATACVTPQFNPSFGASFTWTAPSDGLYTISAMDAYISVLDGDCSGKALACGPTGLVSATKGQKVAVVITGTTASSYRLSITSAPPVQCDVTRCVSGPAGELPCCTADMQCGYSGPDGCSLTPTGVPPGASDMCMNSAVMLPGPYCTASTACSCDKCPQQHLTCLTGVTGCADILRCLQRSMCSGASCSSACASVIAMNGGMEGAAFAQASALQGCDMAAGCTSLCGSQPDASAGGGTNDNSSSGGQFASGGASGGKPTSGGASGGRASIGEDAGTGGHRNDTSTSGGCGCSVPRDVESPASALSALAVAGFAALARRRRKQATR